MLEHGYPNPGDLSAALEGRIELAGRIGAGALGTVHRGLHRQRQCPVAVKLLHPHLLADAGALRCLEREAAAAARIQHPNIVRVLELGRTAAGAPFLVLELVEGPTLRDLLAEHGPLPLGRTLRILTQLAEALSAAHGAGVIHCDLKPGNLCLLDEDQLKIFDFGLSCLCGAGATEAAALRGDGRGTPAYMAPEQIAEGQVDRRADLYSAGAIAYEMLVGAPPYSGSPLGIVQAHMLAAPPAPSAHRKGVPVGLDQLVLRCLAKSPRNRFADAQELVRALKFLGG